jgi:O-antigen ligase
MLKALAISLFPFINGLTPFFIPGEGNDDLYVYAIILLFISVIIGKIRVLHTKYIFFILSFLGLYSIILVNTVFSGTSFQHYFLLNKVLFIFSLIVLISQVENKHFHTVLLYFIALGVLISILILIGSNLSVNGDYRVIYGVNAKNYLFPALYVSIGMALSFIFFIKKKSWVYLIWFLICFLGSVNALSRTAFFAGFLVIIMLSFRYLPIKNIITKFFILLGILPILSLSAFYAMSEKMLSRILEGDSGDRLNRWDYWGSKIVSEFPTGGGLGIWYPKHPHNLLIQYTSEGGILVIIFLVILFIAPFFTSLYYMTLGKDKSSDRENYTKEAFSAIYFILFMEYMKSQEIHSGILFWITLAILIKISFKSIHQRNRLNIGLH